MMSLRRVGVAVSFLVGPAGCTDDAVGEDAPATEGTAADDTAPSGDSEADVGDSDDTGTPTDGGERTTGGPATRGGTDDTSTSSVSQGSDGTAGTDDSSTGSGGEACSGKDGEEGCACELGVCASNPLFDPIVCEGGLCVAPSCGDGVRDPGEECDDGDILDADDCPSTCVPAFCGDEFLHIEDEWCDGEPGLCGADCDAQPIEQWTGMDEAQDCRLAVGPAARVHHALGNPTNAITTYATDGTELWQVDVPGGRVTSVAARSDGEVVVGVVDGFGSSATSMLARYDADGGSLGTVALPEIQTDAGVADLHTLGVDLWVASTVSTFGEDGHHLCRYTDAYEMQWCTEILADGSGPPDRIALDANGRAVVSTYGPDPRLWWIAPDGTVETSFEVDAGPNASSFIGAGVAFGPGGTVAAGWTWAGAPGLGVVWSVYDEDANLLRHGQSLVRDVDDRAMVAFRDSGELLVGSAIEAFATYGWLREEDAAGNHRFTRRAAAVPSDVGHACDLVVVGDEAWLAARGEFPDRWVLSRLALD